MSGVSALKAARTLKESAMQGLSSQLKLANAIRYLRERNRYVLDHPVEKRNVRPPILSQFRQQMQARRNGMVGQREQQERQQNARPEQSNA